MKRKLIKILIICLVIILVGVLVTIGIYNYALSKVAKNSDVVTFTISEGSSAASIIDDLYESNIIRSKLATKIYVKLHNTLMQAGTYELDRSYSTREILEKISNGEAVKDTITVTFIEGKRLLNYVSVISENFGYSESEVLEVLSDTEYLEELITKYYFLTDEILNEDIYYPLEGYLYPSTYEFYRDASIKTIIEKMLDEMGNVLKNYQSVVERSDYSYHEILTIASIIENETKYVEDKAYVSEVVYKRLELNMSLGMDVTTYYAVQKELTDNLTSVDLNSENAYNTRNTSYVGLPVGPISNPGNASIEAALNPADTEYIYFYADVSTGKLYFAETYSEFLKLKELYS